MAKFVVEWVYSGDTDKRMQARPQHREYCRELGERGVLLAGGPFGTSASALLVYEAADVEALHEVLADDPYTKAGVIALTTIREWNAVTGSWVQ